MQMGKSPMTQFWSTDSAPMQMADIEYNMKKLVINITQHQYQQPHIISF